MTSGCQYAHDGCSRRLRTFCAALSPFFGSPPTSESIIFCANDLPKPCAKENAIDAANVVERMVQSAPCTMHGA